MSSSVDSEDYTESETVVGNVSDFQGSSEEMKEVAVGNAGKCLLIKSAEGTFSAIGTKCTHYGAPLIKGSLHNGKIQCPWHGACFNAKNGDIEDYPGLDSLACYQVNVDESTGDIKVKASRKILKEGRRNVCTRPVQQTIGQSDHVVIIGGGPSSQVAAETLRCRGFGGKITIVSKESYPPYDRAKLSKALDVNPGNVFLRKDEKFYHDINVNLILNTEVTKVDVAGKTLVCNCSGSQSSMMYDRLIIATGGQPRSLNPLPGWNLKNVFSFRSVDDANKIAKASQGGRVVVIGSSFIGMEVAAYMTSRKIASSVSVVCGRRSKVPFQSTLGSIIGNKVMKMHQDKGVKFYPSVGVKELIGNNGSVEQVILTDGSSINADVVILGIGVVPCTNFLKSSNILLDDKGYIPVDGKMRTSEANIYAVGDIVTFPLKMKGGELVNIQHWQMAHKHGQIAANHVVDSYSKETQVASTVVDSVPFFWTVQFGTSIRYAGHAHGYSDVVMATPDEGVVTNDTEVEKFCVFYLKDDVAIAVSTVKCDPIAAHFARRLAAGNVLKRSVINEFMKQT